MMALIVNEWRRVAAAARIGGRFLMVAVVAASLIGGMAGCGWLRKETGPVVPKVDTPREQTSIAHRQYIRAQGTADPDQRKTEYRRALAAFDTVVKSFPEDREYTPLAHLMKGDIYFRLNEYRKAESEYRAVSNRYADIGEVHAGALQGLGEALYELGRHREGKEAFRQLMDTYGQTDNALIRDRVSIAKLKYEEIN